MLFAQLADTRRPLRVRSDYASSTPMSATTSSGHAANVCSSTPKSELQSPLTPPFLFDLTIYTPLATFAAWKGMEAASNSRDT